MTNWTHRIKARMTELDMTQEELAHKLGITRGAITHYLAGRRQPPLNQFQNIANVLKVDPAWLQYGLVSPSKTAPSSTNRAAKAEAQNSTHLQIPVLTWELAAKTTDTSKLKPSTIKEWVPHFFTDKKKWYALRVNGDSMTAPLGNSKSFQEGDLIVVDSDAHVEHGSFVIALLPRSKESTFKQYVVDGGKKYLKPLNPQYPIVEVNSSTRICGVVIMNITELIN